MMARRDAETPPKFGVTSPTMTSATTPEYPNSSTPSTPMSANSPNQRGLKVGHAEREKEEAKAKKLTEASPVYLKLTSVLKRHQMEVELSERPMWIKTTQADLIFSSAVTLQGVMFGLELELSMKTGNVEGIAYYVFIVVGLIFTLTFLVEWMLRVYAFRMKFLGGFVGIAETLLVLASLFGTAVEFMGKDIISARAFESLRLLRIFRLFRMARVVQKFDRLRELIEGLKGTIMASFGTIGLLLILAYVGGLICAVLLDGTSSGSLDEDEELKWLFGSVPRSVLTNIKLAFGEAWPDIAAPMASVSSAWSVYCVLMVCLMNIAVMSVVTGVVCEQVLVLAATAPPPSYEAIQQRRQGYANKFRRLFGCAHVDRWGNYPKASVQKLLKWPEVKDMLQELEIDLPPKRQLMFIVLDACRGSGSTFEDWFTGIMRLQGSQRDLLQSSLQCDMAVFHRQSAGFITKSEAQSTRAVKKLIDAACSRIAEAVQIDIDKFTNLQTKLERHPTLGVSPVLLTKRVGFVDVGSTNLDAVSADAIQIDIEDSDAEVTYAEGQRTEDTDDACSPRWGQTIAAIADLQRACETLELHAKVDQFAARTASGGLPLARRG